MKEKLENIKKIEMLEKEICQDEDRISKFFPKAKPSEQLLSSIKGNIQAELRQQSSRRLYRRITAIAACIAVILALTITTYTNQSPAPQAPLVVAAQKATININWDTDDDAFVTLNTRLNGIENALYSSENLFEENNFTNLETQISELYATLLEG